MIKKVLTFLIVSSILSFLGLPAKAVDFSLGSGWPYLASAEISIPSENNLTRYYANYKVGLDDGYSVGFERQFDESGLHAWGMLIGSIGVKDDPRNCNSNDVGCAFANLLFESLDEESTVGLGFSYSFNPSGLNKTGWRFRFEAGYGEGRNSKEKRADGSLIISYQF